MGILSQLFKSSHIPPKSYVRIWAEQNWNELASKNFEVSWPPEQKIFFCMMFALSRFGSSSLKSSTKDKLVGDLFSIKDHSGDAILFELGCYLYSRVDLWLFANAPAQREAIALFLADNIIQLFNCAFKTDISHIFDKRVEGYGWLVRQKENIEESYQLEQLMMLAINNRQPCDFDFKTPISALGSAFSFVGLKIELSWWMPRFLPIVIDFIKMAA